MLTLAATAAVRAGVALAIAERERVAQRSRRRRERHFGRLSGEDAVQGLRRMLLAQTDLAIEQLTAEDGALPNAGAVHEARKALKRLRTLLKLLEAELGAEASAREGLVMRECGRRLAGMRDAEVMVDTLEDLTRRHPRKLGKRAGVKRLRAQLVAERERAAQETLSDTVMRAEVLAQLRAARARMAAYPHSGADGWATVEPALGEIYRKGRRRHRRALRGSRRERAVLMHRWRKRVKDLRYACEALDRAEPRKRRRPRLRAGDGSGRKGRGRGNGKGTGRDQAGEIGRLAKRADRLGERLGEEHDLVLLEEWLCANPARAGRRTRARLGRAIARRRRRLQRRALRDGERLFARAPKKLLATLRAQHARPARASAFPAGRAA